MCRRVALGYKDRTQDLETCTHGAGDHSCAGFTFYGNYKYK